MLRGVHGTSADDVWAVGISSNALLDRDDTVALHWDGAAWSIIPTPNPDPSLKSNSLYDVAAIAPDDAWAVGSTTFGPNTTPLLLHWNGAQWSMDSGANDLPPSSAHAVRAVASDDVWVLGNVTEGGTGFSTLAAHFDGSDWTPTNVPNAAFGGIEFQAADSVASDDIWGAGYENPGQGIFAPFLAHWDGNEWTSMNPPQPVGGCTLHDIVMIATDDAWAVGRCQFNGLGDQPYAIHWDGAGWTPAAIPILADGHARLEGVDALASDDVWATGTDGDANGVPYPLLMHYDGATWQKIEAPISSGSHEWFHGVNVAGNSVFTVGQFSTGGITGTLTMRLRALVVGDIDGDGVVSFDDVAVFADVLTGVETNPTYIQACDLNGDGATDGRDVPYMMMVLIDE